MNTVFFCDIELKWDDFYWLGESKSPSDIELHINSKDEEPHSPHDLQVYAWNEFVTNHDAVLSAVLSEILKHYIGTRPRYVAMGPEWIEHMPEISSPEDIKNMITLNSICINWPYDEGAVQLGMSYSCVWEREHGLGVVLENNAVKEVGGADCAII